MGSWSEIVSDIFNGWKKVVQNMRGIIQNGTKERRVCLATHLLKQSEFRGQIIESYKSPNDSLNFITRARIDEPPPNRRSVEHTRNQFLSGHIPKLLPTQTPRPQHLQGVHRRGSAVHNPLLNMLPECQNFIQNDPENIKCWHSFNAWGRWWRYMISFGPRSINDQFLSFIPI